STSLLLGIYNNSLTIEDYITGFHHSTNEISLPTRNVFGKFEWAYLPKCTADPIVHFDEQSLLLLKCSGEAFFVAQIP
ncbi:MAG: hypothetical protein IJ929_02070, partial [Prevotella sp.]|nr:hypothetical protein [Prevotella sp.]